MPFSTFPRSVSESIAYIIMNQSPIYICGYIYMTWMVSLWNHHFLVKSIVHKLVGRTDISFHSRTVKNEILQANVLMVELDLFSVLMFIWLVCPPPPKIYAINEYKSWLRKIEYALPTHVDIWALIWFYCLMVLYLVFIVFASFFFMFLFFTLKELNKAKEYERGDN